MAGIGFVIVDIATCQPGKPVVRKRFTSATENLPPLAETQRKYQVGFTKAGAMLQEASLMHVV